MTTNDTPPEVHDGNGPPARALLFKLLAPVGAMFTIGIVAGGLQRGFTPLKVGALVLAVLITVLLTGLIARLLRREAHEPQSRRARRSSARRSLCCWWW